MATKNAQKIFLDTLHGTYFWEKILELKYNCHKVSILVYCVMHCFGKGLLHSILCLLSSFWLPTDPTLFII